MYSLLAFIFFMGITSVALLSYGVSIPYIILPDFKAEQLYIKLDKKLIMHAKRIDVTISSSTNHETPILKIPKLAPVINLARKNFQLFEIEELHINGHKVTFRYTDSPLLPQDNSFTLTGANINAYTEFKVYKEHIFFELKHFIHEPSQVNIHAQAIYDFDEEMSYTDMNISLASCGANIDLVIKENANKLAFSASSNVLADISPIVKLFELDDNLYKWIVPYNQARSFQLIKAKGIHDYSDTDTILQTLFIHAQEKELAYTFNEELSAVVGKDADIYFSKGILDVRPNEASYNQHKIDKGGVLIDFNGKNVILKVDLYADIPLDEEIVRTVEAYNIPLPLLQKNGTSKSHVKIVVNLDTQDAHAIGQFFIKDSDLYINKVPYKIHNTAIRLHKNILSIDTAKIKHKNILDAELTGQIDLKDLIGDFYFDVQDIALPLSEKDSLQLLTKNPRIQLHLDETRHSYIFPQTAWVFNDFNISVNANEIFMSEKFSGIAKIDDIKVKITDLLDFNTSGVYDISNENALLDINLSHFKIEEGDLNISLETMPLALSLNYLNDQLKFNIPTENTLYINNNHVKVKPTTLVLEKGYIDLNKTKIYINNEIRSQVSTHYKLGSRNAKVKAEKTTLFDKGLLYIEPDFELLYHFVKGLHYLDIPKHGIHGVLNTEKEFDLVIKDFSKLKHYSKAMELYDIQKGEAKLTFIDDRIGMDINIHDFHPLLSNDGKDVTKYTIKGEYQNQTANLQINNKLDLLYRTKGKLTAKDVDFNLFPILDYLELIDTKNEKNNLELLVKTKRCNVSLDSLGRRILSDTINMQIKEDDIHAQLIHHDGGVLFESRDHNMTVHGRGLNDKFMNELFKFSTFKGGKLSFVMQGPFDNMDGIINIENSVIEDYTVLNNTLAFFNTIPSLVTFSVPDYSKTGLNVQEMYGSFHKDKDLIKIHEAKITSKELIITAKGQTDLEKESIDLLMQVKTDIGSSAKDIPLLGYIIFGDDTVSTTVKVHGDLHNPQVESSVAKSIIVAPYNILKRTLSLPFLPFMSDDEEDNTTKQGPALK